MLLNPSHEITHAGLPQDVQERYVRYKQGSRAIVNWMTKYGPDKYKGRKTLPIKQMIALGRLLCAKKDKISSLPPDVDYYFQEVIKERTFLSQHFRKHRDQCQEDEIDTINHEHFTESLRQIYAILLTVGKSRSHKARQHKARSSTSSISEVRKGFHHLLIDDQDSDLSDEEVLSDTDTDATSDCSHSEPNHNVCGCEEASDADFLDTEGEIGMAIEVFTLLDKISSISEAVKSCWSKTGAGEMMVAASTAYTNVLVGKAVVETRAFLQNEEEQKSFNELRIQLSEQGCLSAGHMLFSEQRKELLDGLCQIDTGLSHSSRTDVSLRGRCLAASLTSDLKDMSYQDCLSSLVFDGIAFHNDLRISSGRSTCERNSLSHATIVYLVSISHAAYSQSLPKPALIALPRINALKTANEALSTIRTFTDDKNIFPCQCINTLGYRITQMRNELESFSKYRCWNTLVQSPLIAGNHTLEILDLCSFYGMHLLHYRQYVAAVLHTYQALVSIQQLESNAALDNTCQLLSPVLYSSGNRPDSGFMACWLRYIGARLKFKTGKKHQNHKDTWCMSVPAHTAARTAGLNIGGKQDTVDQPAKFDLGTIDYVCRLKHNNWTLSLSESDALDRDLISNGIAVQTASSPTSPKTRSKHKRTKSCHSNNMGQTCEKLDHILNNSFSATDPKNIPSSRFNLLALFSSMTKVVAGISDATHADDSQSSPKDGKGQMCLCFVQTILRAVDRVQDVRKRKGLDAAGATFTKNEKECVESYKNHLNNMLEDSDLRHGDHSAWLWSSL